MDDYFTTAQQHAFKAVPYAYTEELDKDHGRLETRRYWITDDLSTLPKTDRLSRILPRFAPPTRAFPC